jgi:hypothetical protein
MVTPSNNILIFHYHSICSLKSIIFIVYADIIPNKINAIILDKNVGAFNQGAFIFP